MNVSASGRPGGETLTIVGLISGTSADGIDAALVDITGSGEETELELRRFRTTHFPEGIRQRVLESQAGEATVRDVAELHAILGDSFAQATVDIVGADRADLVGSHGQTVAHLTSDQGAFATLQIGSPAIIAARTGLTVVSDFRSADIAAGGEGAPLVPILDRILLRRETVATVALNIGGIANLTYIPAAGNGRLLAFDTGPGNAPIDHLVERSTAGRSHYDAGGRVARNGTVDAGILRELLEHPYLQRPIPKSTGREEFGAEFADGVMTMAQERGLPVEDAVATLTRFTAASIAVAVKSVGDVDEIFVSGGGTHNRTLMDWLAEEVHPVPLRTSWPGAIPVDAKEAVAFAVLANQTVRNLPGNIPSCTGARRPAVLGSITPGRNYGGLMRRLWT